jgi:hypothetical protein
MRSIHACTTLRVSVFKTSNRFEGIHAGTRCAGHGVFTTRNPFVKKLRACAEHHA